MSDLYDDANDFHGKLGAAQKKRQKKKWKGIKIFTIFIGKAENEMTANQEEMEWLMEWEGAFAFEDIYLYICVYNTLKMLLFRTKYLLPHYVDK